MASAKTQPAIAGGGLPDHHPARTNDRRGFAVLRARPRGRAERVGSMFGGDAAVVFTVAMLAGLAVIAAISIGLGLLVTHVIEPSWGIGAADERVNVWLAAQRTPVRTHASLIGSTAAGGVVLPVLVGAIALVCAVLRKWRVAAFVLFALAVESATYRLTTLAVHSHRPTVVRLENLPVNASYPSGHTAASVAVYGGLALLVTSKVTNVWARVAVWTLAVAMVTFVAASRMYRGMHHPLDVGGGLLVGVLALFVIVFACRVAGAAYEPRSEGPE
jgi:membrane-associated phospholipid phosphatase